jgi:THO complex subunit 4
MSITLDAGPPPRQPRRVASAPSLINRIQKPALAERLGAAEDKRVNSAS